MLEPLNNGSACLGNALGMFLVFLNDQAWHCSRHDAGSASYAMFFLQSLPLLELAVAVYPLHPSLTWQCAVG